MGKGDAAWNTLERVSYVWLKDRWVAYPFQVSAPALLLDEIRVSCAYTARGLAITVLHTGVR